MEATRPARPHRQREPVCARHTCDCKTAAVGDRLLLMAQTAGAENGLYTDEGDPTALVRTADANTGEELHAKPKGTDDG